MLLYGKIVMNVILLYIYIKKTLTINIIKIITVL